MTPPTFDVASLVPSSRDFLQAVRTARKGLALIPNLGAENAAREALRMAEADVTALAMPATEAMAEAAAATRLPMLSLGLVSSPADAMTARALGADCVLIDPGASPEARELTTKSARSTRMVALPLARTRLEVEREAAGGAKALVVQAADLKALRELAEAAGRLLVIAWPGRPLEDDVGLLRGVVDAVVVGVDVYGVTGFERLVSELNP
jgi:indole-3-glycerol phosphate synthase